MQIFSKTSYKLYWIKKGEGLENSCTWETYYTSVE